MAVDMSVTATAAGSPARPQVAQSALGGALEAYAYLAPLLLVLVGLAAYPLLDGIWTSLTDRAVTRPGTCLLYTSDAADEL